MTVKLARSPAKLLTLAHTKTEIENILANSNLNLEILKQPYPSKFKVSKR